MQLEFFKFAIGVIYATPSFVCTRNDVLAFTTNKSMTKREAESLVDSLVSLFWLESTYHYALILTKRNHGITYGARTLMELQSFIEESHGPLPECGICHDAGTVGVEWCATCTELMHVSCRKRFAHVCVYIDG
jgi:hypothetical protein